MDDLFFMKKAFELAKKAYDIDEVPIGCVIVKDNNIIGYGYNKRNTLKNSLAHAEIEAINMASKAIGDWRIEDTSLYVTVEPCPMCAGAIIQARIKKVVFGAENKKAGCAGSILNILCEDRFNHKCDVVKGVMEKECSMIMSDFFKRFRRIQ